MACGCFALLPCVTCFGFMISRRDELQVVCLQMYFYGCLQRVWKVVAMAMLLLRFKV